MSKWTSPTKQRKKKLLDCARKYPHMTREAAEQAIAEVAAKGMLHGPDVEAYRCDRCGYWHWGRTKNPVNRRGQA